MLKLKGVTKIFPGVKALDNVSIEFLPGEIHAIIGENGAGKSTLMKIICGIYKQDDGKIYLRDNEVRFNNYHDALDNDISLVYQEIEVVPESSISENIVLDKLKRFTHRGKVNWKEIDAYAKKYLELVELDLDPRTKVLDLSAAQKQLIQIARALSSRSKILLLDEPTSSLTQKEAENLFAVLRNLKDQGLAIIFISHKIEEVMSLCDKITVLRDGKNIGTKQNSVDLKEKEIIKMMIGRETENRFLGFLDITSKKVLEVKELSKKNKFNNISFDLYKGEILGFYGLIGSGRTEVAKAVIGEDIADSGEIYINEKKVKIKSVADSLYKYKMGYVTENRKEEGLILSFTVKSNIVITVWKKIVNKFFKFISIKKEVDIANDMVKKLHIKTTGIKQQVNNLSGGNQQKVSISKWIAAGCDILIIDEPTVGVDVGAKEYIHDLIWKLAKEEGKSIILISSDMPEIITLARRLIIFKEKEIVGEVLDLNKKEYDYNYVSKQIGQYLA